MRGSVLVKIGIRLILAGVLVFLAGWYWAPITVAVNQPVSLGHGHIQTREFEINNENGYTIGLVFDKPELAKKNGCNGYDYPSSIIRTHWVLSQYLRPIASGSSSNYWIGEVVLQPGTYSLSLEVLSNTECLNQALPRLTVACNVDPDPWKTEIWAGFLILLGVAIMLPTRMLGKPVETQQEVAPSPHTGRAHLLPRRKWPLQKRMSVLPQFGLAASLVIALSAAGYFLSEAVIDDLIRSTGLPVSISQRTFTDAKQNTAVSPVIVTIFRSKGLPTEFLLNGRAIKFEDLRDALRKELSRRPDWVVFVDGDANLPFQDVAAVVDTVQGLHAKAVLLSPKMKQAAP